MRKVLGLLLFAAGAAGCTSQMVQQEHAVTNNAGFETAGMAARYPADTGGSVIRLDSYGYLKQSADLPKCGGRAQLVSLDDGNWRLKINGTHCGNLNLYTPAGEKYDTVKLEGQGSDDRHAAIDLISNPANPQPYKIYKVEVASNSGKSSDTFYVTIRHNLQQIADGSTMRLDQCGGMVQVKKSSNGDVHINFKGVQNCRYFDIVSDEDGSVRYPVKFFKNESPSFTLPKSLTDDWGPKKVLIQVRSENNLYEDKFYVSFFNW